MDFTAIGQLRHIRGHRHRRSSSVRSETVGTLIQHRDVIWKTSRRTFTGQLSNGRNRPQRAGILRISNLEDVLLEGVFHATGGGEDEDRGNKYGTLMKGQSVTEKGSVKWLHRWRGSVRMLGSQPTFSSVSPFSSLHHYFTPTLPSNPPDFPLNTS